MSRRQEKLELRKEFQSLIALIKENTGYDYTYMAEKIGMDRNQMNAIRYNRSSPEKNDLEKLKLAFPSIFDKSPTIQNEPSEINEIKSQLTAIAKSNQELIKSHKAMKEELDEVKKEIKSLKEEEKELMEELTELRKLTKQKEENNH